MIIFKIKFKLHDVRKSRNISQKKLAELTGYSQAYISLLELNKNSPTLIVIDKIATAMDIHPCEFFEVEE